MPKRFRRSASRMRSVCIEALARDRARAPRQARGAWWRAPRAGRRRPASSPRAACCACSARYSVWPVKAMPASLITLFCTGAVTMASNSPARQPCDRAVEEREHVAAVGRIEPAGDARPAQRRRARRPESLSKRAPRSPIDDHARVEASRAASISAQVRADAGGLARGQRDDRALYRSSSRSSTKARSRIWRSQSW